MLTWLRKHKLLLGLIIVCVFLQYKLWFARGGLLEAHRLKEKVSKEQAIVEQKQKRNQELMNQVNAIKTNKSVVEAHARSDLGMVKPGEEYLQVIDGAELSDNEDNEGVNENSIK